MFINSYKIKGWFNWPLIRAHLCTVAVALSFSSTWRIPRDAFRYGGLVYGIIFTVAMIAVALPITMLQLSIGQLSQQGAVGVWKAVPFFKGIGYLRLLISLLSSIHTTVYVALITTYFLYSISNSIPFWECQYIIVPDEGDSYVVNASSCFNETFLAPVTEKPEYYIALALIVVVLSTLFPFVLFSRLKLMKRIFYTLGPLVLILGITISSSIADRIGLSNFYDPSDSGNLLHSAVWNAAIIQSLVASQTTNGFLILASDTIYSSAKVQWTSLAVVSCNLAAGWAGIIFWHAMTESEGRDTSPVTVLIETYRVAVERNLTIVWPLLIFIMLFFSGIVTMLTLLYPIYDHCRRVGGPKWRYLAIACSVVSVAGALAWLAGGLTTLSAVEDVAMPVLISFTTVMEILAFLLIYGWKTLSEDVEFLIEQPVTKWWVLGWFGAPCLIAPFATWWAVTWLIDDSKWTECPWEAILLVATIGVAAVILIFFAIVSVANQVQYDTVAKLQASFRPSRHWGPRDPVTHYYWLARRDGSLTNLPRISYRRQLGQYSRNTSVFNISNASEAKEVSVENKRRSNSDDWLYTVCRKTYLEEIYPQFMKRTKNRSKSLDWSIFSKVKAKNAPRQLHDSKISVVIPELVEEANNNIAEPNRNLSNLPS